MNWPPEQLTKKIDIYTKKQTAAIISELRKEMRLVKQDLEYVWRKLPESCDLMTTDMDYRLRDSLVDLSTDAGYPVSP